MKRFLALLLMMTAAVSFAFAEKLPAAWEDMAMLLMNDVPVLQKGAYADSPASVLVIPQGYRTSLDLSEALEGSRIRWVINRSGCCLKVPSGVRVFSDYRLSGLRAGDVIIFGHYPQSEQGTDRTAIEWVVLKVDKWRALLISRYGLDCMPYHEFDLNVQWKNCSLRRWLNTDFMGRAFTEGERKAILLTTVDNSHEQQLDFREMDGEAYQYSMTFKDYDETYDHLFIPSYGEAVNWFGRIYPDVENKKALLTPTSFAVSMGADDNGETETGETAGPWWLRSPGATRDHAAVIVDDGDPDQAKVTEKDIQVRPCFWLNLHALDK